MTPLTRPPARFAAPRFLLATAFALGAATALPIELRAMDLTAPYFLQGAIQDHIVSSSGGSQPPFTGNVINVTVGATTFYNAGFTGASATAAVVDAGSIWGGVNGHETLQHVVTYVHDAPGIGEQTGETDIHATWVGQTIGGRAAFVIGPDHISYPGDHQVGIAPNADLWSGAVATHWIGSPYASSFDLSSSSYINPYKRIMVTGVVPTGGTISKTADVISSSFGDSSDPTGANGEFFARAVDALALVSHKTVVFSAGNSGPAPNTVGSPGAGFNTITVGALAGDQLPIPYSTVASFSSRSPSDVFIPTVQHVTDVNDPLQGTIISNARARVDLVAPGDNLTLAIYLGQSGGNSPLLGTPLNFGVSGNYYYTSGISGTSFSAPVVAGGATLIADAARTTFGDSTKALDGRVMKAILLNSADKNVGTWNGAIFTRTWDNGQTMQGSVLRTTRALDYAAGAGRMNLTEAYSQLMAGTEDVPGLTGGQVQRIGWDFGKVVEGTPNDYYLNGVFSQGATLATTLDWFAGRGIDLATNDTTEQYLFKLKLQVWDVANSLPNSLVAESIAPYITTQHLYFNLPHTGEYMVRVEFGGVDYDLIGAAHQVDYGLAWAVPEPASIIPAIVGFVALAAVIYRRRRLRLRAAGT